MKNATIEAHIRRIITRKNELDRILNDTCKIISNGNIEEKIEKLNVLSNKLVEFQSLYEKVDYPVWLKDALTIIDEFSKATANKDMNFYQFQKKLELVRADVLSFQVRDDLLNEEGMEFDRIFEKYMIENRLDTLFNKTIKQLMSIIETGAIDNETILEELQLIISTLQKNKNKSYFSERFSWDFFKKFFFNTLHNYLQSIPVIGPALSALSDTIKEVDEKLVIVETSVTQEIRDRYGRDINMSLTYNSDGYIIQDVKSQNLDIQG